MGVSTIRKSASGLHEALVDNRLDFKDRVAKLKKEVRGLLYSGVALLLVVALFIYIIVWGIFKFVAVFACDYSMWNWDLPISKGCVDLSQFWCFARHDFRFNSDCHSDNPCCNSTSRH